MKIKTKTTTIPGKNQHIVLLTASTDQIPDNILTTTESEYIRKKLDKDAGIDFFHFNRLNQQLILCLLPAINDKETYIAREKTRRLGSKTTAVCKQEKIEDLFVVSTSVTETNLCDFLEGLMLANYSFSKYKKQKETEKILQTITLSGITLTKLKISELITKQKAVFMTRDWVNEPGSALTPALFTDQVRKLFSEVPHIKTEVFTQKKIAALKMSGIEAVSKGGPNPPAFIVLEYLPKKLKERNPYVLVGKGVFFDTGGINLKPGAALADMKCDMSGAAAVASTMYLIALTKPDVPVVGIIPATENRPGNLAYLPGDVLKMMNGTSVEIKNTDAEGRLILADALCYAKKYNPALAITIATLTGSAHATFGPHGIAGMQENASFYFSMLQSAGHEVYERIAELPMWQEYDEMIESTVADIQNVGGKYAGAITAAKFLYKFADFPFIHLDIAGPAFLEKPLNYIPAGGSGVGVRLFFEFFQQLQNHAQIPDDL
jgi:leucyl aminopeptidase